MLIEIRDKASSWVAYIVIGLLVLSFAFWGIQEYFGGGGAPPVASINGSEITQFEFNQQFQQRKQVLQSILGNSYAQQYPDESVIKKQVIGDMVRSKLLRQEATDAGFRISNASLVKRIKQIPQFQKNGKFDPAQYERLLQSQRYSKAQFENELREQDKLRQFETALAASSFIPKADLQRFQKLSEQSRDFRYVLVKVDPETVKVTSAEIESYYQENQQLFQNPEKVKLAYIELKEEELIGQIDVSVDYARVVYDGQLERYMTSELRRARQILVKVPNDLTADDAVWDAALDKASGVAQQLKDGVAFEDLAKQHSEDQLSAEKGGEIGLIARGDFASTELQEALFSLEVGENSKPIRTEQGIQILKLDEIQVSEQKPFEDVQEQIVNERKGQLAQQQFIEIADELANLMAEQPDELLEASESFDLDIKLTGWLAHTSNAEIFAYPKIQALAFSDDVLNEGLNSELVEVADGHVIAFRLLEHKKSEQRPLEQVNNEIGKMLMARKAAEQSITKGKEYLAQMQSGNSLEELSAENSLELIGHGALRRDDNLVSNAISEHVFNLLRPASGKPTVDGIALPNGSYALIELHEVIDGAEELDDAKALQLSQRVNYGRREFNAIVEAVKENSDVQVFENNL